MTVDSIRKLAGVLGMSHTILNRHLKAGKFRAEPDGTYDPVKVRHALRESIDVAQSRKVQREPQAGPRPEPVVRRVDPGVNEQAASVFNRARAKREVIRMEREELELKVRKGELVEASKAAEYAAFLSHVVRDHVLAMADRLAAAVAALGGDADAIYRLIREDSSGMLRRLSKAIEDSERK